MTTAFIADLHLTAERPVAIDLFQEFLTEATAHLGALFILGDLFEYWVGDDGAEEPEFAPIITALGKASNQGLKIYVMHGNRDFLLGTTFAHITGCTLITDPYPLDLFGTPTLLSHGDMLCTDDQAYMALRAQFRNPAWQEQVLARSLVERVQMARALRIQSGEATGAKSETILDVNQQAVTTLLQTHHATRLIHGHTHRPGYYPVPTHSSVAERIVVGDWYEQSSVLVAGSDGLLLTPATDFTRAIQHVTAR